MMERLAKGDGSKSVPVTRRPKSACVQFLEFALFAFASTVLFGGATAQKAFANETIVLLCNSDLGTPPVRLEIDYGLGIARHGKGDWSIVSHNDVYVTLFSQFDQVGGKLIVLDLSTGQTMGAFVGVIAFKDKPPTLQAIDNFSIGTCKRSIIE